MLSHDDIKKLAKLASLSLTDPEIENLKGDLNSILDYMQKLEQVNVTNVEPMSHVHGLTNVFRADKVAEHINPKLVKENAPEMHEGFFKVPLIIEHQE
jgi:aspartyl-tRNA(Asn)/glutamyl-tRNA(Gln) amidotransferase subunit C